MLSHWLLIAVALAAAGAIDTDDDCCSSEDKTELSFMWHQVWHTSYTDRKVKIMRAVWEDLTQKHPEVRQLMEKAGIKDENTPEFRAHVIMMAHGLDNLINLLDDPMVLEEQIDHAAAKWAARGTMKKSYFAAVADAFESTLPKVSTCFNTGAWNRCLNRLASALSAKLTE